MIFPVILEPYNIVRIRILPRGHAYWRNMRRN